MRYLILNLSVSYTENEQFAAGWNALSIVVLILFFKTSFLLENILRAATYMRICVF